MDRLGLEYIIKKVFTTMNTYRNKVRTALGTLINYRDTSAYNLMCEEQEIKDSIEFAWLSTAASTKRVNGVTKYFNKIFSLLGTNEGEQTTESAQPYVFGDWIPSGHEAMKNPNGDGRYITHPEISFAADEEWSVTTVLNWTGDISVHNYYMSDRFGISKVGLRTDFSIRIYNSLGATISLYSQDLVKQNIGKSFIITLIADGLENLYIYINGSFVESYVFDTSLSLNTIAKSYYGSISAHIIRAQALTPAQVLAEANLLQSIYPEIPSVTITDSEGNNAQTWAVENCEMVATPQGSVIANVEEAANVDGVTNGTFTGNADGWILQGTVAYNSNNLKITADGTSNANYFYQLGLTDYEYGGKAIMTYTIVSNTLSGAGSVILNASSSANTINANTESMSSSVGTHTLVFDKATSGGMSNFFIYVNGYSSGDFVIDNISIEEVGWSGSQDLMTGLLSQGETQAAADIASAMWAYHSNDTEIGSVYGKIYNGNAKDVLVADIATQADWGYHIATESELTTLATNGGYKLKVEGSDYWTTANGTNSTGFSALGGGTRSDVDGTFSTIKNTTAFWCADSDKVLLLNHADNTATITAVDNGYGAYIRFVKD